MSMTLHVALLHYPVYDKNRRLVATAVTNMDVHDISRQSATFGVRRFYVVTPVEQQRELVKDMLRHWTQGAGAQYNPRRREAIAHARVVADLSQAAADVREETGHDPVIIGTGANVKERMVTYPRMREILQEKDGSAILVFGTGWGLEKTFLNAFDFVLAPVLGVGEYNHLSVRSASAIILDRLAGGR